MPMATFRQVVSNDAKSDGRDSPQRPTRVSWKEPGPSSTLPSMATKRTKSSAKAATKTGHSSNKGDANKRAKDLAERLEQRRKQLDRDRRKRNREQVEKLKALATVVQEAEKDEAGEVSAHPFADVREPKKRALLLGYALTASVAEACRAVGVAEATVYTRHAPATRPRSTQTQPRASRKTESPGHRRPGGRERPSTGRSPVLGLA